MNIGPYASKEDATSRFAVIAEKLLDYHFSNSIRKIGSFEEFLKIVNGPDNASVTRRQLLYNIPEKILVPVVKVEGKSVRVSKKDLVSRLSKSYRLVGKKDAVYRSGKEYHRPSFWLPTDEKIEYLRTNWKSISETRKNLDNFSAVEIRILDRIFKFVSCNAAKRKSEGAKKVQDGVSESAEADNGVARTKEETVYDFSNETIDIGVYDPTPADFSGMRTKYGDAGIGPEDTTFADAESGYEYVYRPSRGLFLGEKMVGNLMSADHVL